MDGKQDAHHAAMVRLAIRAMANDEIALKLRHGLSHPHDVSGKRFLYEMILEKDWRLARDGASLGLLHSGHPVQAGPDDSLP